MLLVAGLLSGRMLVNALELIIAIQYISRTVTCRTLHFPTQFILCFLYISVPFTQYCSVEKNAMGGACSAYGGEERRIQGFGGETRNN